ncbi:hypothetical protein K8B33_14235 [Alcanivorax sp. JB21]|uniref:hypothetical protein n=1 Tax=Alcanivorax limicola TaxID=2874102 RepID=UPI001CBB4010|nr:hypothetical protein [Alcanivorax limicola]MBZ2190264.1 hypothetical protein [Alcanivorax limicola]
MTSDWRRWRARLDGERPLLRELALLLVVCLMVGIYFLHQLEARLVHNTETHLTALADQVAHSAGDYIVAGNLVSLNVIARHTGALAPVARVQLEDAGGRVLASSGPSMSSPSVTSDVMAGGQDVVGTVRLWAAPIATVRQQAEAGFVLLVLVLLALRIIGELLMRRWRGEPLLRTGDVEAEGIQSLPEQPARQDASFSQSVSQSVPQSASQNAMGHAIESANAPPAAVLCLSLVNQAHLSSRYTRERLDAMLAPYDTLLATVSDLYGARLVSPLIQGGEIAFANADVDSDARPGARSEEGHAGKVSSGETAFHSVCAGMLFLRAARRCSEQRKAAGELALEFKLLVSTTPEPALNRACCDAGLPGRVHVRESDLTALELDTRSLYRPEQALVINSADASIRLQPLEQLAQRYQKLINDQAARILAAFPAEPAPVSGD